MQQFLSCFGRHLEPLDPVPFSAVRELPDVPFLLTLQYRRFLLTLHDRKFDPAPILLVRELSDVRLLFTLQYRKFLLTIRYCEFDRLPISGVRELLHVRCGRRGGRPRPLPRLRARLGGPPVAPLGP